MLVSGSVTTYNYHFFHDFGPEISGPEFQLGGFFCGESLNSHELEFVVNHKSWGFFFVEKTCP